MKVKVWVLSTCIPEDPQPCWPEVFGSFAEAQAAFKEAMTSEWESNGPRDEETGALEPMPADMDQAHDRLSEYCGDEWGRWEITTHEIEVAESL